MSKAALDHQFDTFGAVPLSDVPISQVVEVVHIERQPQSSVVQRLSGLGIVPGTTVRILSGAPFHGPLQIEVRGTRIVLGRGLAAKILVRKGE